MLEEKRSGDKESVGVENRCMKKERQASKMMDWHGRGGHEKGEMRNRMQGIGEVGGEEQ